MHKLKLSIVYIYRDMDGEKDEILDLVNGDINGNSKKEISNGKKEKLVTGSSTSPQDNENDIVLYPIAPKARAQVDEQVDVKISPAFQILDQVIITYL